MRYRVKEIFYTLQGEGANTGRPAVFACSIVRHQKVQRRPKMTTGAFDIVRLRYNIADLIEDAVHDHVAPRPIELPWILNADHVKRWAR